MSNVLGELFGDIANAIREKTGDTATMKPAEFPSKISGIEVGGGGGLKFKRQYVSGISSTWGYRVSVDFGFKPDILIILPCSMTVDKNCAYWGCTQAFADAVGDNIFSGYSYVTSYKTFGYPIDTNDANAPIYNADATGFNFGKTPSAGGAYVFAFGL